MDNLKVRGEKFTPASAACQRRILEVRCDTYADATNMTAERMQAPSTVRSVSSLNGMIRGLAKYRSQTMKAISDTPPMTIMEMIPPSCHLFAFSCAKLRGRVINTQAATIRRHPMTANGSV